MLQPDLQKIWSSLNPGYPLLGAKLLAGQVSFHVRRDRATHGRPNAKFLLPHRARPLYDLY